MNGLEKRSEVMIEKFRPFQLIRLAEKLGVLLMKKC